MPDTSLLSGLIASRQRGASQKMPLTLRGRVVLPMHGPALDGGWVRIVGSRIIAVGRRRPDGPVIDLGDSILLPGLVNPHCHLEFSSISTPLPPEPPGGLAGWIPAVMQARFAETSNPAAAIAAGLHESAAAGVTLIGEIATAPPTLAYPTHGVPRLRLYRECLGLSSHRGALSLKQLRRSLDRVPPHVSAGISPHAAYSVHAGLARQLLRLAAARHLPVAVHLAESREEHELLAHDTGPFRTLLERLGAWPSPPPRLLSTADWISLGCRAPRAAFIHATHLDEAALARLSRHRDRAAVIVCPRTATLISGQLAPLQALRRAGVRVAIGTDGRGSAPDLSPRHEAAVVVDRGLVSPDEAVAMITTDAAWAIASESTAGQLAAGRRADLAVLRPNSWSADPAADVLCPTTEVVATLRGGRLIHAAAGSPF